VGGRLIIAGEPAQSEMNKPLAQQLIDGLDLELEI